MPFEKVTLKAPRMLLIRAPAAVLALASGRTGSCSQKHLWEHVSIPKIPPFHSEFCCFFSFRSPKKTKNTPIWFVGCVWWNGGGDTLPPKFKATLLFVSCFFQLPSSVRSYTFPWFRATHRHLVPTHASTVGSQNTKAERLSLCARLEDGRRRLVCSPRRRPRVQWGGKCCQCLSVQKPGAREGAIRRRGGSANLGRRSEAPRNIGHWPIFFPSLRRKEDLSCKNSPADSNTFISF